MLGTVARRYVSALFHGSLMVRVERFVAAIFRWLPDAVARGALPCAQHLRGNATPN